MISVGIIGGSGYLGKKLVLFANGHEEIADFEIYGNTSAGQNLLDVLPEYHSIVENKKIKSMSEVAGEHDVYFVSLPHGESLNVVPQLLAAGKKVIDLGGDYRLDSAALYEKWYNLKHTSSALLNEKVYGLADVIDSYPAGTNLIANPGCYPTATLLSLLPLVKNFGEKIIASSTVAYSGSSGAGKSPKTDMLLSELDGNVKAYNVHKHRHEPEILQHLNKNGFHSPFSFTTHLLPVAVGIYATTSVHLDSALDADEVKFAYDFFYKESAFVRLRNTPPQMSWTVGTNFCDLNVSVKGSSVIITAAIDNLIKGGAGQAMQNMNKLFGWDETLGLTFNGAKNVSVY